jgi:predicted phage baseplate assembly protein
VPGDTVRTTLALVNALAYTYRRDSVQVYGNVAQATQGETRTEVLGSADATRPNQQFRLRQVSADRPLTALPADNPRGQQDAVTVRVNGVRWHEVEGLVWADAGDHAYAVRVATGSASVAFGDGLRGARPATGVENVTASYRVSAGEAGNVASKQIAQLATRPLGVNAVTNPLPATGGTAADGPEDTRVVTPLRVHALDRLLSAQDYEDFTRARAGVGKASAGRLFDGTREVVHVTVAGVNDVPIDPTSLLFTALQASLAAFGDPHLPVRLAVRDLVTIVLSAGVRVLPDYSWDDVEPAVRAAVLASLGFDGQDLGECAYLSTAIAAMQAVPGVDFVDVDVFKGIGADVTPLGLLTVADTLGGADASVPTRLARYMVDRHGVVPGDVLTSIAAAAGLTLDELVSLNPGLTRATLAGGTQDQQEVVTFRGIRPAQLAILSPSIAEALTLRRIP